MHLLSGLKTTPSFAFDAIVIYLACILQSLVEGKERQKLWHYLETMGYEPILLPEGLELNFTLVKEGDERWLIRLLQMNELNHLTGILLLVDPGNEGQRLAAQGVRDALEGKKAKVDERVLSWRPRVKTSQTGYGERTSLASKSLKKCHLSDSDPLNSLNLRGLGVLMGLPPNFSQRDWGNVLTNQQRNQRLKRSQKDEKGLLNVTEFMVNASPAKKVRTTNAMGNEVEICFVFREWKRFG